MEYNLLQLLRPKTLLIFHSFIFMFNLFLKWKNGILWLKKPNEYTGLLYTAFSEGILYN